MLNPFGDLGLLLFDCFFYICMCVVLSFTVYNTERLSFGLAHVWIETIDLCGTARESSVEMSRNECFSS